MNIADIIIILVIFIFQKIILPLFPVNLPFFSYASFVNFLENTTMKFNFIWGLAGLNNFINLPLLFTLIIAVIFGEILFWVVKAGFFFVKLIRG